MWQQGNSLLRWPVPAYWESGTAFAFHWTVPYGTSSLDPRLIEIYRQRQPLGARIPLVVEYSPPDSNQFHERRREIFEPMDDFAWTLERLWEVEWMDVPPDQRPGLVLTRPGGTVVLCSGLPPRIRDGLMVLSSAHVRADAFNGAVTTLTGVKPTSADVSRALATLRAQGIVHLADESIAWSVNRYIRRGRRPYKVYLSLPHEAERLLWLPRKPGVLDHGDWLRGQAPSIKDGLIEWSESNQARWATLVARLRQRGLRTI